MTTRLAGRTISPPSRLNVLLIVSSLLAAVSVWADSPLQLPASAPFTLAVGTQQSAVIPRTAATVQIATRPYFSPQSSGAPAVEFGGAAVSFVRDGTGAGIVILGRDTVQLPLQVPLDADGRSVDLLHIRLTYDGRTAVASVSVNGVAQEFITSSSAVDELELTLSAGAATEWSIEDLAIGETAVAVELSGQAPGKAPAAATRNPAHAFGANWATRVELRRRLVEAFNARDRDRAARALAQVDDASGSPGAILLRRAWLLQTIAAEMAGGAADADAIMLAAREAMRASVEARAHLQERPALLAQAWRITGALQRDFEGDLPAAEQSFQRAVAADPGNSSAHESLRKVKQDLSRVGQNGGVR